MRVAYLINQYPRVSHTFIRREIRALERLGIDVFRVSLRGWDLPLADDEDRAERSRTHYVLRSRPWTLLTAAARIALLHPTRVMRGLALAWRMGRHSDRSYLVHIAYLVEACHIVLWLNAARVEHLHAHFGTNSAEVAMFVHALGGPRWSFTVHGSELLESAPFLGLPEKVSRCAFVAAVCSFGRAQLCRLTSRTDWNKIKVIHCGLEAAFHTHSQSPPPTAPRFVCVGRLSEEKGHLLLLEAARGVAAQGVKFELVLAGDGPLRQEVEAFVKRHNLGGYIRITGWISSDQVRQEILAARALVLPSFAEGLPVVVMEAMALRRPVIATFVGGVPELVTPGEHGWLVPAGDADALRAALEACILSSNNVLERMGTASRTRVLETHNIDREAARLAELFKLTPGQ